MTHDLLKNVLESMDVTVNKVEICDLKNDTYYTSIHVAHKSKKITVNARPKDAIALSLRMKAPVFVSEDVINRSPDIESELKNGEQSKHGKNWQGILEMHNKWMWIHEVFKSL